LIATILSGESYELWNFLLCTFLLSYIGGNFYISFKYFPEAPVLSYPQSTFLPRVTRSKIFTYETTNTTFGVPVNNLLFALPDRVRKTWIVTNLSLLKFGLTISEIACNYKCAIEKLTLRQLKICRLLRIFREFCSTWKSITVFASACTYPVVRQIKLAHAINPYFFKIHFIPSYQLSTSSKRWRYKCATLLFEYCYMVVPCWYITLNSFAYVCTCCKSLW